MTKQSTKNWNCDNDKCRDPKGEIRKLPMGGGANGLLCRACFEYELRYRRQRWPEAGKEIFPSWESLEVYTVEGA